MTENKIVKIENETNNITEQMIRVKIRKIIKKNWWLIVLCWMFTVGIEILTAFFVTGWKGIIIGTILSTIPFLIGLKAILTVVEKVRVLGISGSRALN